MRDSQLGNVGRNLNDRIRFEKDIFQAHALCHHVTDPAGQRLGILHQGRALNAIDRMVPRNRVPVVLDSQPIARPVCTNAGDVDGFLLTDEHLVSDRLDGLHVCGQLPAAQFPGGSRCAIGEHQDDPVGAAARVWRAAFFKEPLGGVEGVNKVGCLQVTGVLADRQCVLQGCALGFPIGLVARVDGLPARIKAHRCAKMDRCHAEIRQVEGAIGPGDQMLLGQDLHQLDHNIKAQAFGFTVFHAARTVDQDHNLQVIAAGAAGLRVHKILAIAQHLFFPRRAQTWPAPASRLRIEPK